MKKEQDRLLKKYDEAVHGVIFTQVSVGEWSQDKKVPSRYRYIDGVRVIPPKRTGELKAFGRHQKDFKKDAKRMLVEAIEVDYDLNRHVIGQAVVGKVMLEIEYEVYAAIPVVVCRVRDKSLEQACVRLGVTVWTPRDGFLLPAASSVASGARLH